MKTPPAPGETWGPYTANSNGWYGLTAPAFTPGPLLYQQDDSYIENWRVVKMLPDGPTQVAGAFTEADARLYASAPDLLAALEGLLLSPDMQWDELEPATYKAINTASAAIAKAKGNL